MTRSRPFPSEFLNRLDDIVIFDVLAKESTRQIVDTPSENDANDSPRALALTIGRGTYLAAEKGYNRSTVRSARRTIQDKILTPLASLMVDKA